MCIFSFGFHECGHRGIDHIDTSSCRYFAKQGVHCQEDNAEHRRRAGGVVISTKNGKIPGNCVSCFPEEKDSMERAMANSMRTAKEEDDRRREERRRAAEERERANEQARQERKRKEQERADQIEKARLDKAAAAEKRRHEEEDKAKRDAARRKKLKERKEDERQAELRRQRELAEAEEDIRRQEEQDEAERRHRQKLRQKHEDANRRQAERDEAERKEAAEQREREKLELERRQKEIDDHNPALAREAQEAKDGAEAVKREAEETAARELDRKLAPRRVASETQPTHALPTEQTSPVARPPPPSTKPALDISGVIGHHGSQEIGYGMLGNRRVPIHESQRRPESPKTPASPPVKRGPAPISRLSGTIESSPHDYKIQQPSLVATPGTPTPDWKMNIRKTSVSTPIPAPEATGVDAELKAKLARQKALADQGNERADKASPEKADSDWEMVNKPSDTTTPAHPTSSAPLLPAISNAPPPTYPVVPPLAHPKLQSASPLPAKPKPPVPVKRMSSTPSQQTPSVSTQTKPSIPTPPPISSLPSRFRVDSASPSPQVGSKMGKSSDWDDSGSESESEGEDEGRLGGDGAWDVRNRSVTKKAFSPDDVFGEQRRKGWKAA